MVNQARIRLVSTLTIVSMVLGFMLSLKYQQAQNSRQIQLNQVNDVQEKKLQAQLTALKQSNAALQTNLTNVNAELARYENESAGSSASLKKLQARIEAERILSGVTAVRGEGVAVTLMDGQGAETEQVLTHDWDVRQVINELFTAGAEAVSINGYRVVATSGIYCTGPVVRINSHRIGAPFLIEAIGDPSTLNSALNIGGGILDALRARGVNASPVQTMASIKMPAFAG